MNKRLLVLGDKFTPPTIAHSILANSALKFLNANEVLLLSRYVENDEDIIVTSEDRLNMLNLFLEKEQKISGLFKPTFFSDDKKGLYDMLLNVQRCHVGDEIIYIISSKELKEMYKMEYYEYLLRDFKFAVYRSGNDDINAIIKKDRILNNYKSNIYRLDIDNYFLNYINSSSEADFNDKTYAPLFLSEEIRDYIEKNNLYYKSSESSLKEKAKMIIKRTDENSQIRVLKEEDWVLSKNKLRENDIKSGELPRLTEVGASCFSHRCIIHASMHDVLHRVHRLLGSARPKPTFFYLSKGIQKESSSLHS